MTRITIEVEDDQARRLADAAQQREITVEELIRSGALALLEAEERQFAAALEAVLRKNRELYRRLA